jgi:hypothetical protein
MSKGISYLAAYRMAQADQMNQAYKQALMEIQTESQRAEAYGTTIAAIDKQIAAYEKLLQKISEEGTTSASKNEILDAEIALANVYAKNASNAVSVYRYADQVFDAPSRVSSEIQSLGQQRAPYYTAGQIGNLNTHLAKPEYKNIFADLTPEQTQDAAIKLYNQIQSEAAAGLARPLTSTEKASVASSVANAAGINVSTMTRAKHQQAKQSYIDNAISQSVGSTARLESAITRARSEGANTPDPQTQTTPLEDALVEAATLIASDGVIDNNDDQSILFATLSSLYDDDSDVEFTLDGQKVKKKFVELDNREKAIYFNEYNIPNSVDALFRSRVISGNQAVQEARQVGRINRNINLLQQERAGFATQRAEAIQAVDEGITPENLRERQAELFAQTLSDKQRKKYLTEEQLKRIEFLESQATTKGQKAMEAKEKEDPFAGMSQDEINVKRAMAAAVLAREQGKDIKLNEVEQDSYRALADLVKNGTIAKQDIYNRSMQLASQMGGLPDARRNFAQSVASRIYLDLYDDQKALQASTQTLEDFGKDKKGKDQNLNLTTDIPQPDEPPAEGFDFSYYKLNDKMSQ